MQRADLLTRVQQTLAHAGFTVSERCDLRPVSFDLVARRDTTLILLKVLTNVDALSMAVAHEIKLLCQFLEARPVLVGLRSGTGELEDGVVYARHDIPIVTPDTLAHFILQGEAPMVFAAPGGFYVNIDGAALRLARQHLDMSLGTMAQIAGVSRRAIQMYEEGMSASIDAAMRLEEALGADLIRPVDPFRRQEPIQQPPADPSPRATDDPMEALVRSMLQGLGYEVRSTRRSPFNALSTRHETVLTGMGRDSPQLRRRAKVVSSISEITGRPGFFVVERTTRTSIEGTPALNRTELANLTDPEAILELILERQARRNRDLTE